MARILIIEDEDDLREPIRTALERLNHIVYEAANGADGLECLRQHAFDLVITDVLMPEVDGLEVIQTIAREFPGVKVLAMSGGGTRIPAKYSLTVADAFGAHALLQKPFGVEELQRSVAKALALCRHEITTIPGGMI